MSQARAWPRLVGPRPIVAGLVLLVPFGGSILAVAWPGALKGVVTGLSATVHGSGAVGLSIALVVQVLVATSGILPASLVGLAAGAVYGVAVGFPLAAASLLAGALLTFGLSRSMFRAMVARLIVERPRLGDLDLMLARDGWKLVCLLRVSPVMPFAATSYALGLTSIQRTPYLVGTLASLPALLGFVVIGSCADAMTTAWEQGLGGVHVALLAAGLLATAAATLRIGRMVRTALQPIGVRQHAA